MNAPPSRASANPALAAQLRAHAHVQKAKASFWIITLAAVLVSALTAAMGFWQLDRAAQKKALQTQLQSVQQNTPWTNTELLLRHAQAAGRSELPEGVGGVSALAVGLPALDWLYQPVHLRGQWLPAHTVYLDNRPMQGRVGYWVYTPLKLESSDAVMLVLRGWVPRNFAQREALPAVHTPSGVVTVPARLQGAPSKLFELHSAFERPKKAQAGAQAQTAPPQAQLNLDMQDYRKTTGLPLLPYSAQQVDAESASDPGAPPGATSLLRQWAAPNLGLAKHYGYAFQWFGLALTALLLYLWFQWFKPVLRGPHNAA